MLQLNDKQDEACQMALWASRNPGKVVVLSGPAGTGKTSTLKEICRTIPGCSIWAPTGRAAQRAKELSGQEAITIHRGIYKPVVDDKTGEILRWDRRHPSEVELPSSGLLIIEEGSMVHNLTWDDIYKTAMQAGISILIVGDSFQLPPVSKEEEEPFSVFGPQFNHDMRVDLTEVWRQALDSPIIRAATAIRSAVTWRAAQEVLGDFVQEPSSVKAAAKHLQQLSREGEEVTAICYTNAMRHDVNRKVRMEFNIDPDSDPFCGEPLLVRKNNYNAGVFNGQIVDFTGLEEEFTMGGHRFAHTIINNVRCCLSPTELLGGTPPSWDVTRRLDKKYVSANLGYCLTAHAAQGCEFDKGILIFERKLLGMDVPLRLRWIYTAVTRFKTDFFLYPIQN